MVIPDPEKLEALRKQSPLIHMMSHELTSSLTKILDVGDLWAEIASQMPDISAVDIEGCRRYREGGNSPSYLLLRVWASKGYSIVDLYNLFAITRLVRCMQLMRNEVDSHFHYLEELCAPSVTGTKPRPHSSGRTTLTGGSSHLATQGTPSNARSTAIAGGATNGTSHVGTSKVDTSSIIPSTSQSSMESEDSSFFSGMKNTPAVTYSELLVATDEFSNDRIIGKGGYGVVYKGEWKQTQVAVKRLTSLGEKSQKLEKERLRQSLQELNTLALYRHDNILPVYAYSLDGPEPCLVYQFMANGSLEDRLQCKRATPPLSWMQKAVIARGSAMALHFLHSISRTPLIHGDVKTANILLDKHLEPKLGDFGLSREGKTEMDVEDKCVLIASHIKGTLAYLPPEFINSKILTTKLDVYSFGVVLLEIATGLRAFSDTRQPSSLVDFCAGINAKKNIKIRESDGSFRSWHARTLFDDFSDKRTPIGEENEAERRVYCIVWSLGLLCSLHDRHERPSFKEVVAELKEFQ